MKTARAYYQLTKPGIILGNAITGAGGFLFASKAHLDPLLFLATLVGLCSVIASACVFNNYIDRENDTKMARTRNRALATGAIAEQHALLFATFLVLLGLTLLFLYANLLTVLIALAGFLVYVGPYSFLKTRSVHATLIGSLSGAVPPVIGYCAVTHHLDSAALLLFAALLLWQMPHFYAIALCHTEDYEAASIPTLPLTKGVRTTKIHMLSYIIGFTLVMPMLFERYVTCTIAALLGCFWLLWGIKGFWVEDDRLWARQMFKFSLVIILGVCLLIFVCNFLI